MKKLLLILCLLPVMVLAQPERFEFNRAIFNDVGYIQKTVVFFDVNNRNIDIYSASYAHYDILSTWEQDGLNFRCVDKDNDICFISIFRDVNDGKLMLTILYVPTDVKICFYEY